MTEKRTIKQTSLVEENPRRGKLGQQCVFCQIAKEKTDSLIVFQDEISTAFLDKRPLFPGHCLLVPNEHYVTISELPLDLVGPFFINVKLLAIAVEKGLHADGSFLGINNKISQSVAHLHVHIVPRRSGDGLRGFFYPRQNYASPEEAAKIQQAVKAAVTELKLKQIS
ncbi:MAG: HIT family protein [Promethearchaeati archaeon SRVP18_Atabeyarchaeia-1]